jgi:hypothetical protein
MKRKLAWVCLLVSLLVIGGTVLFLLPRDPITQANCDRIKIGMTEKEVESILGRKNDQVAATWPPGKEFENERRILLWTGARGTIYVELANFDKTVAASPWFKESEPESFFEKIRNWLGL